MSPRPDSGKPRLVIQPVDENQIVHGFADCARERLLEVGFMLERAAKITLSVGGGTPSKHPTGDEGEYWNSMRGGYVRASAAGDPPHTQTGNLRASIATAATDAGTVIVGPTSMAMYGRAHEFGTRTMPKRPFMAPALQQVVVEQKGAARAMEGMTGGRPEQATRTEADVRRRLSEPRRGGKIERHGRGKQAKVRRRGR